MKLWRLVTLAMALQALVTAAALLASYLVIGAAEARAFGTAQLVALLASGSVAVLLALICARLISRDIAERGVAEAQLMQARKMEAVGRLTGGIAHEFNNMLTVITGTIDILADAVKHDAHLSTITSLISEAADRGAALTSSLLSFASRQSLQPAEIDVNELIEEVARLMLAACDRQIEIATRLDRELWPALVDRRQLGSALLNLAFNARDAMPEGGTLTLTTRNVAFGVREAIAAGLGCAGDYVEIGVADTGTGITQSNLERIFDPFFSTKEVGKGTGLGLSMVFGFVAQSGGSIEVRSDEGRGTTFRICLPVGAVGTSDQNLQNNPMQRAATGRPDAAPPL